MYDCPLGTPSEWSNSGIQEPALSCKASKGTALMFFASQSALLVLSVFNRVHGSDLSLGRICCISSGVDQKTTQYSLVKTHITDSSTAGRTTTRWIQSSSRRMHSHDVRALAHMATLPRLSQPHTNVLFPSMSPRYLPPEGLTCPSSLHQPPFLLALSRKS